MSRDVRTLLHDAAATPATPPDVGAAVRAGRRLRARRNAGRAVTGVLAAAMVVGIASVVAPPSGRVAAPAATSAVTPADVEAFANRAAVEASLSSAGAREYRVRTTKPAGGGWIVDFDRTPCRDTRPGACVTLLKVSADGDALVVGDALGAWAARDRAAVLGYRGAPDAAPELKFRTVEIARSGGAARLIATSGWTGPIPPRDLTVDCVVRAYDGAGTLVATRALDPTFEALPHDEAERAGGYVGVGVPAETESASIECATFRSEGAAAP